ncbi:alkaline phosphatase [Alicyclobacillus contaminans]|uniref:DedA family protein n=1 Tax=Alicyclobacillus contaminans TaxID=392016 RepID=UPI00047DF03F|nr:DedA family protein [Alicyclobacillus contaminans]GMA49434.1 alkaline phosphatase [Alicyclobacillus contaminans]
MAAHLSTFISHYGSLAIFVLMTLESIFLPVGEPVMGYAGYLAYTHELSFFGAVVVGTIANVIGGTIAYAIGLYGGRPFIHRYGRYVLLSQSHLQRAERWFAKYGEWTVFFGRLLPGVRTVISYPAGVAKMRLGKFFVFSALGSLPWNFAMVFAGFQLGKHWEKLDSLLKPLTYFGVLVLVVAIVWFWFGKRRASAGRQP